MSSWDLTRRGMALAGLAGLAAPALARGQERAPVSTSHEREGLLVVPVTIDERGPFAFAIDSAANTSVVARDLAAGLALRDAGEVTMHTVVASERAPTARANRLRTGDLDARDIRLVVADREGLLGLDGLLGTDLLGGLRLVLNFRGRARINVTRARRRPERSFDGVRLTARSAARGEQRFNGLLLVDGRAGAVPCKVIVDTGAKTTIVNSALAREAGARPVVLPDGSSVSRVLSPTGRGASAEVMLLPELRLGHARLTTVPVLAGDFHTFGVWGLAETPAVLLGVDLLGLFETVIIDLKHGELLLDD